MARNNHILQFQRDTTPDLIFYAAGPPDGGTVDLTIYTDGDSELEGETWPLTVSADSESATVNANAPVGQDYLDVDDVTGFTAGRRYWVTHGGQYTEVTVAHIHSDNDELHLAQALVGPIRATGNPEPTTVESGRCVYTLSAAQTATKRRRLRAEWVYTVNGEKLRDYQRFDIVEQPFAIKLTEEEIERYDPDFGLNADSSDQWHSLRDGAIRTLFRWCHARQLYPDLIRDREGLHDVAVLLLLSLFYRTSLRQFDRADDYKAMAEEAFEQVMRARIWYDRDDDQYGGSDVDGRDTITLASGETVAIRDDGNWELVDELGAPVQYARLG